MRYDVLVLGAGVAGLAAASQLVRHGLEVLVVEGRGRVGGRVLTLHEARTPLPVELGAELVHEGASATRALVHEAGLSLFQLEGTRWRVTGGKLREATSFDERVDRALKGAALAARGGRDIPFASAIARARVSREDRALACSFVAGFHAADPERVGVRALVAGGGGGAGKAWRVTGGYGALAELLAARVAGSLCLGTRVTRIHWRRGDVRVVCANGAFERTLRARAAVVALPLGVLASDAVVVDPPMRATRRAMARLEVGHVAKLALRFREPFWTTIRRRALAKASFFFHPSAPFPTFWTVRPYDAPLVVAWCGGPRAEKLLGMGLDHATCVALDSFADTLGVPRRVAHEALEQSHCHDWSHDPFALGAYSYPGVTGVTSGPRSATPLEDTLYFAGEHTAAPPDHGTVHGAVESGLRAARLLLARRRRRVASR